MYIGNRMRNNINLYQRYKMANTASTSDFQINPSLACLYVNNLVYSFIILSFTCTIWATAPIFMPSYDVIHYTLRAGTIVHYDAMFAHRIVTLTVIPLPFASLYVLTSVIILGTFLVDVGGVTGLSSLIIS